MPQILNCYSDDSVCFDVWFVELLATLRDEFNGENVMEKNITE